MEQTSNSTAKAQKFPTKEELLAAGVQFGHETRRWNPLMSKYILGQKNNIHVFDVEKTGEALKAAAEYLTKTSETGKIMFVGTKNQASQIIKDEAIRAGAYFVNVRWAGGLFTNFAKIKQSLMKLQNLEKSFEEGVKDRTKYEVAIMKREWQKLNRLYSGLKTLEAKPLAVVVLDTNYERSAVKEAKKIGVPVVGIVDSNSDPKDIDYVIPANDDALKSIKLIVGTLADAVLAGNKGNGVKHNIKDYSKYEVKITKEVEEVQEEKVVIASAISNDNDIVVDERPRMVSKPTTRSKGNKGILERIKEEATIVKEAPIKKEVVKKEAKAPVKAKAAEAKKPVAKKETTKAPAKKSTAKASTTKKTAAKK